MKLKNKNGTSGQHLDVEIGIPTFRFMVMCALYCCQTDIALGSLAIRCLECVHVCVKACEWKLGKLSKHTKTDIQREEEAQMIKKKTSERSLVSWS